MADGRGGKAVFVRAGWIRPFVFEPELCQAQLPAQPGRRDERSSTLLQADFERGRRRAPPIGIFPNTRGDGGSSVLGVASVSAAPAVDGFISL